jgi:hypothetical protein
LNRDRADLHQRADYTYKHNRHAGRHGWLRLTPAYSVKIVEAIIGTFDHPMHLLDPFCGTATTALTASYLGHEAVTLDINPFLVWLGRVKTAFYSADTLQHTKVLSARIIAAINDIPREAADLPPLHNIERWWPEETLSFLSRLRRAIDSVSAAGTQEHDLLLAEMLARLGLRSVECRPLRKRSSKRELIEFDVFAVWP